MNFNGWLDPALFDSVAASIMVVVLAVVARIVLTGAVSRHVGNPESRRRWLVSIRNWVFVAILLGLAMIWGPALRTFAISLLAVAVAFVIATKELIQCISGSMLRTTARAYAVGDRIEIGSHRGDVIDVNFFSTTIMEVGAKPPFHLRTGRTVVIPNSKLVDTPVVNESFMKGLVLHTFAVPLKLEDDWERAEQLLLKAARAECKTFVEPARAMMEKLEREHGLEGIPLTPRVSMQIPDPGKITLVVRFPAPVGRQGRVEQAILRRFLKQYQPLQDKEASLPKGSESTEA